MSKRKEPPKTLSESLGDCPIPFTHDRLREVHHWWHELAHKYHEPDPFRYALGAFLQAARSVTYMLQKEQAVFSDFAWYREWAERAKNDPLLSWLNAVRTIFVHQKALEPKSWMRMQCIDNPRQHHSFDDDDEDDGSLSFNVSPFACTHYYISQGWRTDHIHEFTRHWEMEGIPLELLDASASIYDRLDELVLEAHRRAGREMPSYRTAESQRALPCMVDTLKHRVIRTALRDGKEIWEDEPPGLHQQ